MKVISFAVLVISSGIPTIHTHALTAELMPPPPPGVIRVPEGREDCSILHGSSKADSPLLAAATAAIISISAMHLQEEIPPNATARAFERNTIKRKFSLVQS